MLDLQQLRYFVAVATTGNVGKAAKQLGMTQSPLSRQIQALEARLGLELFERQKKRLFLTSVGREVLVDARHLLALADKTEAKAKALSSGDVGTLAIGYVEGAVHAGVLPGALHTFRQVLPGVSLELKSRRSGEQFACLQSGEIDVGFTYEAPSDRSGLHCRLLHEEPLLLVYHQELFPNARPSADDLNRTPFVALSEAVSPNARQDFLAACHVAGFRPDIKYEVAEPSIAMALVAAGLGVAIVQKSLKKLAPETVLFTPVPGDFPARLAIYLVCRQKQDRLTETFLAGLQ